MTHEQFNTSLKKLKACIAAKGYHENLGQKELDSYCDWLFTSSGLAYSAACKRKDAAQRAIDAL